jgi:tetratricopeptide (TPR) repeat protein
VQEAMRDYNTAIQLDPKSYEAYDNLASAKLATNDTTGAMKDLAKSIELKEDHADAYFIRAEAHMKMKKYQAAVDDLNSCLYISLENTKVYAYRAYAESFIPDEKDRMNADFSYAAKVEPKNPDTYYLRGLAKLHLNDKTACNDLNTAASLGSKAAQEDVKKYCH